MARIILKLGGLENEVPLPAKPITFGRSEESQIVIPDPRISRRHIMIRREGSRYVVHDLGSANGTWVNDRRIHTHILQDGDEIRIGGARLFFEADQSVSEEATAPPQRSHGGSTGEIVRHISEIAEPLGLADSGPDRRLARERPMFEILYKVLRKVTSALTLEEILRQSIALCFDVMNADRGLIFLREGDRLTPRVAFRRGDQWVPMNEVPYSGTIVDRAVRDCVGVTSLDAMTDQDLRSAASIVQLNIRSALCVPLWVGQDVLGAIYLDNRAASYAFTAQDVELLTGIAHGVALRLEQERLQQRLRQEESLRANLQRFHSPDVVEMLIRTGRQVELGIIERDVSIVFADIADSSGLAERLGPARTAQLLNNFYEAASQAVFAERGHVNNYMGDGVLSIFNATIELKDHPAAAVRSCQRLLRRLEEIAADNPQMAFRVRLGVNTGFCAVGNVGSQERIQYTALGDPVNAAERLCKIAPPNGVVIGEETYRRLYGAIPCRALGPVALRGKEKTVEAFEVLPEP